MKTSVKLTLRSRHPAEVLCVPVGSNLRAVLLKEGRSPYRGRFKKLNCQGMGVCGTCKVRVWEEGQLWQRRSCQIQCFQDMEIELE